MEINVNFIQNMKKIFKVKMFLIIQYQIRIIENYIKCIKNIQKV